MKPYLKYVRTIFKLKHNCLLLIIVDTGEIVYTIYKIKVKTYIFYNHCLI